LANSRASPKKYGLLSITSETQFEKVLEQPLFYLVRDASTWTGKLDNAHEHSAMDVAPYTADTKHLSVHDPQLLAPMWLLVD
jgi:hypothetical protein